jgi:hypothetical protein
MLASLQWPVELDTGGCAVFREGEEFPGYSGDSGFVSRGAAIAYVAAEAATYNESRDQKFSVRIDRPPAACPGSGSGRES